MECHACGVTYRDGGKYCPKCGTAAGESQLDVACETCGKTVKPGAKFCNYCGAPQQVNTATVAISSVASNIGSAPRQNEASKFATSNAPVSLQAHTVDIAPQNFQKPGPDIPIQGEPIKHKHGRKIVFAGGLLIFLIVLAGGSYWFATDGSVLLDQLTGSEGRPAVVSNMPQVPSNPPNPAKADSDNEATIKPPSTAKEKEPGQPQATSDSQPEARPIITPKVPKGRSANEKRAATPPAQPQKKAPEGPALSQTGKTENAGVISNSTQSVRTCSGIGGIYRLTCEIEGAEKYFKCAPDGKNWKHNIDGCDRK